MGGPELGRRCLPLIVLLLPSMLQANPDPRGRPNHLAGEKSPYLLQHAYNPVDWYPWGEAAFRKAREEDRPIFLSIGYAACHWCHVMEEESFSDPKIAALLNRRYVAVKVDREERPDIDAIYMRAVQALTGSGGWPLNVWLTPDLKPFFAGTYFPPEPRWGRPGFPQVLERLARLWEDKRGALVASGNQLTALLSRTDAREDRAGTPDAAALDKGFQDFQTAYDKRHGGFGSAPKFPMPVNQNFLLRYYARTRKREALDMAVRTLREMAQGGIHDQLGGGFHRYSTDDLWRAPHFEKMLYDNAQLAVNYLEAYQLTGDQDLAQTARGTLDYVLREMTGPQGGFFSSEDADSPSPDQAGRREGAGQELLREGAFYLWEKKEILRLLGPETGELFSYFYDVQAGGNLESDPHGGFQGKNILRQAHAIAETAERFGKTEAETREMLAGARGRLLKARLGRPRPRRDDKIIASWNGLMLSALAKGAAVLDEPGYLAAAEKAAGFIRRKLYDSRTHRLDRRWRDGQAKIPGMADDYAFLAQGLLDLYESSFDPRWLNWATELTQEELRQFYDRQNGGFYMTSPDADRRLLLRVKEDSDNAEPSADSISTLNLLRLSQFTGRSDFREAAEKTLALFNARLRKTPRSLAQMLVALDFSLAQGTQIVIAGSPEAPDTQEMLREVNRRFLPVKILALAEGGQAQAELAKIAPFVKNLKPIHGKATAYVCANYACELPTSDRVELGKLLDGRPPEP